MLLPIIWVILSMTRFNIAAGWGKHTPKTVKITNMVGDGYHGYVLTIHCKSKDDDLGAQVVQPDHVYTFKFTPNFWGSTLYSCNFRWKDESYNHNIYDYGRDKHSGPDYDWEIGTESACLHKKDSTTDCYHWKKA
jgi:hypothetical protein